MERPIDARHAGALILILSLFATPAASAALGRTPGTASVAHDGEAGYTIPISLPPGTNGMTPALSLEYRHRTRGGLLGVGWSIGGLSQIARCPRTIVHDGVASPVSLTSQDRFCLDGQRLVLASGTTYGEDGAEYRTEIESLARIRSVGGGGIGPWHFVVQAADGRLFEYGASADSRIDSRTTAQPTNPARVWALNRIRDRSGNVIDFSYTEDATNGSFRIASIRYNSNPGAGVAASHEVRFTYETRPNDEIDTAYVAGTSVRQVVRLDRVDVIHDGAVLRRLELEYEPALSASGRSRLASIRECFGPGTSCLSATSFGWQDGTPGFGPVSSFAAAIPDASPFPEKRLWTTADINGDGRSDFVWSGGSTKSSATIRYRLAQPGGAFGPEVNSGIACPYGIGIAFDRNGDGREDLLMMSASLSWVIAPGTSAGLGSAIATGIALPTLMRGFNAADVNGDGLGDIVYGEMPDPTYGPLYVRVRYGSPGGGFAATPVTLYQQSDPAAFDQPGGGGHMGPPGRRIDFDGDGADDLMLNQNFSIAQVTSSRHGTLLFDSSFVGGIPVDFNGDGCSEFAYKHYTNRLRIRLNGCGVGNAGSELQGPAWTGHARLLAIDWNGDGREDLLMSDATSWRVAISDGDSFPAVAGTGIAHGGATIALAADVSGDGLDDLVTYGAGRIYVRRQNGPKADLLLAATDGLGVAAEFQYSSLTDAAVYQRGSGATYPEQDVQSAAYVVSRLAVTDGSGQGSKIVTSYEYERLRRHLLGRGTLGFWNQTRTDATSAEPLSVVETRRQDFPFTGLPHSIVLRQQSGRTVASARYEWSVLNYGGTPRLRQLPYAANVTTRHHEVGGTLDGTKIATIVHQVDAVDAISGVVTDETTTVYEVAGGDHAGSSASLRTQRSGIVNDTANWCLGRPQAVQQTAAHSLPGGSAVTRNSSETWDSVKCRPTLLRQEPGSIPWQLSHQYTYDGFGNLASRRVSGAGFSTRTTSIDWGSRGQFPVSVKNPLAQVTRATWDAGSGRLLAITDPNGLATHWSYDAFGDPAQQSWPDGTRTTWTTAGCDSQCEPRARFRVIERDVDNTGAIRIRNDHEIDQYGRVFKSRSHQPGGAFSVSLVEANERGQIRRRYLPYWQGDAAPGYWEYGYDPLGRLTGARLLAGSSVERSLALRRDGHAVTQTDALGHTRIGTRTAWGRLSQVEDAVGNRTRYEYDAFGNLLHVHDALNNPVATMTYNALGMKLSQADMDMGTWTWNRNALGEVTSLRDGKSQLFEYSLDRLGRVTSRKAPDGTSSWAWGTSAAQRNIGQLIGLSSPGYSETLTYDPSGRPATRTIVTDASYRYDYTYDSLGLLDSMTFPQAGPGGRLTLRYQYDAGRLSGIVDAAAGSGSLWRLNTQDAAGNPIDESLGDTIRVISGFNPVTGAMEYRQSGAGGQFDAQDLSYAWDDNDNLLRREDRIRNLVEEFRYDPLDRLVESRRNGAVNLTLDYDAIGNIRGKSDVCTGPAPCYAYHATRKHAVTTAGGKSYAYDANGNMTMRGGVAIAWTSDNFPVSIAQAGGNNSSFSYGPAGNRWRQVARNGGVTETTIYAGESMEKVTRNGATTWRHYVMAPTGTAALQLRYSNGASPTMRYLTQDHLGSTERILDPAGDLVVAESFDSFGQRRGLNWAGTPSAADLAKIGAVTRDGFTGHEQLDNLGLVHMNGRAYDPQLGRFISADPYVTTPFDGQGLNRYSYVWNNPLGFVDPSGFDPACVEASSGRCAQITVIGITWADYIRMVGGAGAAQAASALERDPCGQEGGALACALHGGRLVSPASIVLTAGTRVDSTLSRSRIVDHLEGFAARLGNLAISSSPVAMLFGADSDFEWFDEPDTADGRSGATLGNVGYFAGGAVGIVRKAGTELAGIAPSKIARTLQGNTRYPGIDRFKDITLKKGTILYGAHPGQTAFYTTASALRRSGRSRQELFEGLQARRHDIKGYWSRVAAYEVVEDTQAAFGLALANIDHGIGWLPQVVVPSYQRSLRMLELIPLGP